MANEERARRIGANEATFRYVNERIEEQTQRFGVFETMEIVCECGDARCLAQLTVSLADYERIRGDSSLFLVAAGHVEVDVEDAVETLPRGVEVVRKKPGLPGSIAERTDPRG